MRSDVRLSPASALRAVRFLLVLPFRVDRVRAAIAFAGTPLAAALRPLEAFALKFTIDGVAEHDALVASLAALALALAAAAPIVFEDALDRLRFTLEERTGFYVERSIADLAARIPGIEHYEQPAYYDRLHLVRNQQRDFSRMDSIAELFGLATQLVLTVTLLALLDPLLLLLLVLGAPAMSLHARVQRRVWEAQAATAEAARMQRKLFELAIAEPTACEARLYSIEDELHSRFETTARAEYAVRRRAVVRAALVDASVSGVLALGLLAGVILAAVRASQGEATPGDVVLVLTLVAQLNGYLAGTAAFAGSVVRSIYAAAQYLWFVDYAAERLPAVRSSVPAPRRLAEGIALERVSFRYPGTDRDVLRDVSLALRAGSIVALVGENGAGKSTLAKLLCGFYAPAAGRIAVDGRDLAELDMPGWLRATSACFQDFVGYELELREAVGVGDVRCIDDRTRVSRSLVRAGGSELVTTLPAGLDTQLGTHWERGTELSRGQSQKVALARSLMLEAPLLVIFDEPSSSLDAATESDLVRRLRDEALEAKERGAITLVISHRLSTASVADWIVVLADGRVVETGTHDDLRRAGAVYEELFSLYAAGYA